MNAESNVVAVKVNKSRLVLAAFKALGLDTPAKDVIDHIKQKDGAEVTVSLVNNLRSKVRAKRAERAATRKVKPGRKPKPVPTVPAVSELDRLLEVKRFASEVGGVEALKTLVAKLELLAA